MISLIFCGVIALRGGKWQPLSPPEDEMTAKDQTPRAPVLLLAEDSEDDAFFFQRAFRKVDAGCSLVRAENGKVAIDLLRHTMSESGVAPILVFLDLKMPVMSGFEVLEWLQLSGIKPAPKVIVLSGSNDQDDRRRALKLGATDYLVKPITPEILREKIMGEVGHAGTARDGRNA